MILIPLIGQTLLLGTLALALKRLVLRWQRKHEPETRDTVLAMYGAAAVVAMLLLLASRY